MDFGLQYVRTMCMQEETHILILILEFQWDHSFQFHSLCADGCRKVNKTISTLTCQSGRQTNHALE
jgi:hypothetical protein